MYKPQIDTNDWLLLAQGYEKTKLGYYYPDELLPTTENISAP